MGEADVCTDFEFEQFQSMIYGLRAGFVLLRRYIERYNLRTISQIVSRWAPPSENATQLYIDYVCEQVGISSTQRINFAPVPLMAIVRAMCQMESGYTPTQHDLELAFRLASSTS